MGSDAAGKLVSEKRCIGCGECALACAYGAIRLTDTRRGKKAAVDPLLCKGDGLCSAVCATGAISLRGPADEDILEQIDAAAARA